MVDIMVSGLKKGGQPHGIYIDIDIAKLNHFAAVISSDGEMSLSRLNSQMTLMTYSCWFQARIIRQKHHQS